MSDIIINVEAFECKSPIIGDTFRSGQTYSFNWTSEWDNYLALGLNATIKIFYSGDGGPLQLYSGTSLPIPGNANNWIINDLPGYDSTSFQVLFDVDNGDTCNFTFDIPYSSIIT